VATIGTTAGRSGFEDSEVERYLRRRRVLLVDDDASIRVLCALSLRAAEFDVTEVADGLQGFEQATRHPPDLIVSDLRMPGLDGTAATARITAALPETRAVVLTTYESDDAIL
jgi:CheY-like chemotaxis protein